ncbi:MAG: hypothetical protein AAF488_08870 [Planctomycetota bacterium]
MSSSRKFAVVILVVALLVAVGFAPQIWRAAAYEQPDSGGFRVYLKRFEWLPGPETIAPDQPCFICVGEAHQWCTSRGNSHDSFVEIEGQGYAVRFRCTCSCPK